VKVHNTQAAYEYLTKIIRMYGISDKNRSIMAHEYFMKDLDDRMCKFSDVKTAALMLVLFEFDKEMTKHLNSIKK